MRIAARRQLDRDERNGNAERKDRGETGYDGTQIVARRIRVANERFGREKKDESDDQERTQDMNDEFSQRNNTPSNGATLSP